MKTSFKFSKDSESAVKILAASDDTVDDPVIHATESPRVVMSVLGEDIRLSCSVSGLGNRTVSWVRYRDIHLLTVGRDSYTDDTRFSAHHPLLTNSWQLRIRNVSHRYHK